MMEGEGGARGGEDGFGGVDANMDPELAEALRLSLVEEQARAAAASAAAEPAAPVPPLASASTAGGEDIDEDEAMLQQALLMSQSDANGEDQDGDIDMGGGEPAAPAVGQTVEEEELDEEAEIARAIEMSLMESQEGEAKGK